MAHRRRTVRALLVLVVVLPAVFLDARPAWAHAAFVSSDPEPGERLVSAPGVLVLRFSEPLVADLSEATVRGPDGQHFEGRPSGGGEREIGVTLAGNAPGVYEVDWRTVSPLDGHTLKGGFRFGVGVDPGGEGAGTTGAPGGGDALLALLRAVEDAALLAVVGGWLLAVLARRAPGLAWARPSTRAPLLVALIAGTGVVLGEAFLAAPSPSLEAVGAYLTAGSGVPRLARVLLETIGVQLAVLGWPGPATLTAGGALVALAASGHARAVEPGWWGVLVDSAHLLAAGLWAGALLRLPRLRPPEGWRGPEGRELLARFTRVALPAFVATVAFGTLRGTQELAEWGDLVGSSYGRLLSLKILAVAAMVPLSVRAWRKSRPVARTEALLGLGVVLLAAILAAYPLPPRRSAEAAAGTEVASSPEEFPREDDLVLGTAVGDQLVGLTVRPGSPGVNEVLLHPVVIGNDSEPVDLVLAVDGRGVPLEPCGDACRKGSVGLQGGELLDVRNAAANAAVRLPILPAPDGTPLLDRVDRRMHALRSYAIDEALGPLDPLLRATYEFAVPDRMHLRLENGSETVRIGERSWRREGPGRPWSVQSSPPLEVPNFVWDQPRRRGVKVVGHEVVDGVDTSVVSLFASTLGGTEIWYRLWVDAEGLVRRAEMLAAGHFMDQRFSGFDAPIVVEPPEV